MAEIWFTSDTHYGHKAVIGYCDRPFQDVIEMNQAMVDRWNDIVSPKDTIYHLGDFAFGGAQLWGHIIKSLKGRITLIKGNHDARVNRWVLDQFHEVYDLREIKIDKQRIVMCHFPILRWNKSHHGSWHLHGHSHGTLPFDSSVKRLDVGVDVHDFTPINYDRVKEIFDRGEI